MIITYCIEVTYPPNVTERYINEQLGELMDTVSKYGLGVDGYIGGAEE